MEETLSLVGYFAASLTIPVFDFDGAISKIKQELLASSPGRRGNFLRRLRGADSCKSDDTHSFGIMIITFVIYFTLFQMDNHFVKLSVLLLTCTRFAVSMMRKKTDFARIKNKKSPARLSGGDFGKIRDYLTVNLPTSTIAGLNSFVL